MTSLLLDHLWQSTFMLGVIGLLTLGFRNNGASVRHAMWTVASLKFLVPLFALAALGRSIAGYFSSPLVTPKIIQTFHQAALPFSDNTIPISYVPTDVRWAPLILAAWAAGFVIITGVWLVRWLKLRAVLRAASNAAIAAPMPVKLTRASLEPGLFGIVSPILLLPEGIAQRLSRAELQSVLAHEACHLRRQDNLTAALHMLVEAVFWFWPPVWWLGTRLILERERACDEAVVSSGNDPQVYAESILKVCKFYVHSPLACASGVAGADLKQRMEEIMKNSFIARLTAPKKILLAAFSAAAILLPLSLGLVGVTSALAQTGQGDPGAEAAVRHQIESLETKGAPDYSVMLEPLASAAKAQGPDILPMFKKWGALRSVTFQDKEQGLDVFTVQFANALTTWRIAVLTNGKIESLAFAEVVKRNGTGASPGTEQALRRVISGAAVGTPPYEIMGAALATATRQQLATIEGSIKQLGPLKSMTFSGVSAQGWDTYTASYTNGAANWTIAPLEDGKIMGLYLSNIVLNSTQPGGTPNPGTEASLRRYIESLESGAPNYDDMTPAMAGVVRSQATLILAAINKWGPLKSITFTGKGAMNGDLFDVVFEHGHAQWLVGPLTADGKVQSRSFHPAP